MFDNEDEALFPNQFVNIRLLVDTVRDALVVPVAAIQRGQPGTFVYRVKPDDTVEIAVVETGASDGDKVAITRGLALNDRVVVDGVDRLRAGSRIRVPARPVAVAPANVAPGASREDQARSAGAGRPTRSKQ